MRQQLPRVLLLQVNQRAVVAPNRVLRLDIADLVDLGGQPVGGGEASVHQQVEVGVDAPRPQLRKQFVESRECLRVELPRVAPRVVDQGWACPEGVHMVEAHDVAACLGDFGRHAHGGVGFGEARARRDVDPPEADASVAEVVVSVCADAHPAFRACGLVIQQNAQVGRALQRLAQARYPRETALRLHSAEAFQRPARDSCTPLRIWRVQRRGEAQTVAVGVYKVHLAASPRRLAGRFGLHDSALEYLGWVQKKCRLG
jgi:hypothetical protein